MLWAVIMAGGSGTRFWPESRVSRPKQFLSLFGKKSLLEQTVDRLLKVIPRDRIYVVAQKEHRAWILKRLKISPPQVLGEPVGRNTAPCATLLAALIFRRDPNAVLALLPADHRIGRPKIFQKALRAAGEIAQARGLPVTFGIEPDFPHTGYGYLEQGPFEGRQRGLAFFRLKRFHEKPSLSKARRFLKNGRFLWNSGMFVWRADKILEAARTHLTQAYGIAQKISKAGLSRGLKPWYGRMPNISIDYGFMESLKGKILTVPVDIQWHDLGGWQAFADLWPQDAKGNVARGNVLMLDSTGNIVKGRKRLIAMLGVKDLVVVDSEDALLVCPKSHTESIRKIVQALAAKKMAEYL